MRSIFIILSAVLACSITGNAAILNPDGYTGHPSITLYGQVARETDRHQGLPGYWPEYSTHTDAASGAFGMVIPFNQILSGLFGYNGHSANPASQHTFYLGATIHTLRIDLLAELQNPDGKKNSIAITPMIGFSVFSMAGGYNNSLMEYRAMAGMQLGYVATDFLTVYGACMINKAKLAGTNSLTIGARLHLNNKPRDTGAFNPDGRPGSVCIEPTVNRINATQGSHANSVGLDLTVPVFTHLSVLLSGQYAKVTGDRFTGTQTGVGGGLTVHF